MKIADKIFEHKKILEELIALQADYKDILDESAKLDKCINEAMNISTTQHKLAI